MYLMNRTKLDIENGVTRLTRYYKNLYQEHWTTVERVLRFLKVTISYGLGYTGSSNVVEGYIDADWIFDSINLKSTSGQVFLLGEKAIYWKSTKQKLNTMSTMEAELIALDFT